MAYVYFGLAGFVHFLLGWTFLTLSQKRVGAARTGALIGATPLFAFAVGLVFFGETLSVPVLIGITLVIGGVYLVSNG
jgi:drug/metabolite transporter (DMT)-like permease